MKMNQLLIIRVTQRRGHGIYIFLGRRRVELHSTSHQGYPCDSHKTVEKLLRLPELLSLQLFIAVKMHQKSADLNFIFQKKYFWQLSLGAPPLIPSHNPPHYITPGLRPPGQTTNTRYLIAMLT